MNESFIASACFQVDTGLESRVALNASIEVQCGLAADTSRLCAGVPAVTQDALRAKPLWVSGS
jgi:hypothetical protein